MCALSKQNTMPWIYKVHAMFYAGGKDKTALGTRLNWKSTAVGANAPFLVVFFFNQGCSRVRFRDHCDVEILESTQQADLQLESCIGILRLIVGQLILPTGPCIHKSSTPDEHRLTMLTVSLPSES